MSSSLLREDEVTPLDPTLHDFAGMAWIIQYNFKEILLERPILFVAGTK